MRRHVSGGMAGKENQQRRINIMDMKLYDLNDMVKAGCRDCQG